VSLLALVHVHNLFRVDGQLLIGVHNHAEEAGVGLQTENRAQLQTRAGKAAPTGRLSILMIETPGETEAQRHSKHPWTSLVFGTWQGVVGTGIKLRF
jgi:hypothetical protein